MEGLAPWATVERRLGYSGQDGRLPLFLADCIARSMIGYWHHSAICLSVTLCIVTKRYILERKCLNKWIGSALLETWWYNFHPLHCNWVLKLPTPNISNAVQSAPSATAGLLVTTVLALNWLCQHVHVISSDSWFTLIWFCSCQNMINVVAHCYANTLNVVVTARPVVHDIIWRLDIFSTRCLADSHHTWKRTFLNRCMCCVE